MSTAVESVKEIVTNNPGISINGIMSAIGHLGEGSKKYSNATIFGAVQKLKTSGEVKADERVKKNQGLYMKDVDFPEEAVKVSFRTMMTKSAKEEVKPRYQLRKGDGSEWTVLEQHDNEEMLSVYSAALAKKDKKSTFEVIDTQAVSEEEAPAEEGSEEATAENPLVVVGE